MLEHHMVPIVLVCCMLSQPFVCVHLSVSLENNVFSVMVAGDLRLSGSVIRKSKFIVTKERKNIRQKSGCLNHLLVITGNTTE